MDHLLTVLLLLLWSSGAQCDTAAQADIVLLVDESDSVSTEDFRYFKQFVANIVRTFDIGPDRVQIGLAQYSHKVNKLWHLNTHQSEDSLLKAVMYMIQRGGRTMTGKALDFIQKMFQPNVGMRLDSEKIVVLITDGKSLDDVLLPSQRLKDVGIEIYAVGIKGASESELRFIASDPKEIHMYQGRTSLFLQDIVNNIIINLWSSVKTSERVRLVGGSSCCAGTLEVRKGEWRPVFGSNWTLTSAAVMCKELDCGSAVSTGLRNESLREHAWEISPKCVKSGSAPRNCMSSGSSSSIIEITCSGAQCDTAAQADIVLLVDESDSVSTEDFRYFKQFVANIVRTFDIGPDRVQIGLAHYSDVVNTEWHLNTHQSKDSLIEAVGHMRQGLGHRRTGKALDFIQNMFQPNVGMRPDSEKIVVLITDGKSQDDVLVPSQRLKDAGIEICAVGIKRARQSELRSIASYPKEIHMYQGTTSLFLRDIVNNITINLLNSVKNSERVRLVGGSSRCTGSLEVRKGEWRPVFGSNWTLTSAAVMCKELDCGSAVSTGLTNESLHEHAWEIGPKCVKTGSALRNCMSSGSSSSIIEITCSDSVRLVNGTSLCSGRLEIKSNESWSSVCESDFDQQDAEVVCRELGCGAPSVLQGALYGEEEAPMWTKEFQCGGNESALLDCRRSDSARNTCSPRKAVGLTCSEPVRLVRGFSRCAGTLEVKQGDWRPVYDSYWTLMSAAVMCKELDCGPAVSTGLRNESSIRSVWETSPDCGQSGSALRECAMLIWSSFLLEITCSDPTDFIINGVRLVLLPLVLLVFITVICLTHKATRGQKSDHQELMELDYHNPGVGRAEGGLTEEEGGKAAE